MDMAFLTPSPIELMMIAVIALIVLGPSKLPEAARSLGKGMREMRNSFQNDDEDDDRGDKLGPTPPDDEPQDDGVNDDASFDDIGGDDDDESEPPSAGAGRESVGVESR